jgi:GT2 family glycosyltransferase
MNPVAIIIPTLSAAIARDTGRLALASAGCEATLIISDGPKRGFSKTVNDGVKRAPKDADICLLNDDIHWFPHGWLETLRRALCSGRRYGIVGPSGNSSTAPMRDGRLGQRGLEVVSHVPFWCALIRRQLIDKIGMLDEAFIHYASDNWYCDTAKRAGWKCVWCKDVYLGHKQHGSGLIEAWKIHDVEVYAQKARGLKRRR